MGRLSAVTRTLALCLGVLGTPSLAAVPYSSTVPVVTSAPASSAPATAISVPAGVKLVGGGARTNYGGFGSLLTQSYPTPNFPSSPTTWTVVAKDHLSPDPATVTAYAVGINDPTDDWEVGVFPSQPSAVASHPIATAILPAGQNWVLTGGGCVDNWAPSGAYGNLLTASFPSSTTSWECRGKDHSVASPAAITAFVIGIRPKRAGIPPPTVQITTATSAVADLPEAVAPAVPGAIVTGGGAVAAPLDPNGAGQLLTGTYPEINATGAIVGWHAKSKDHAVASPGTVTSFAVNLAFTGVTAPPAPTTAIPAGLIPIGPGRIAPTPLTGATWVAGDPVALPGLDAHPGFAQCAPGKVATFGEIDPLGDGALQFDIFGLSPSMDGSAMQASVAADPFFGLIGNAPSGKTLALKVHAFCVDRPSGYEVNVVPYTLTGAHEIRRIEAPCSNPGKVLLGGGFTSRSGIYVPTGGPRADGAAWSVLFRVNSIFPGSWPVTVSSICADRSAVANWSVFAGARLAVVPGKDTAPAFLNQVIQCANGAMPISMGVYSDFTDLVPDFLLSWFGHDRLPETSRLWDLDVANLGSAVAIGYINAICAAR